MADDAEVVALIEKLIQSSAKDLNIVYGCRYLTTAGFVFNVHDIIVTFARERELIWKAKWSFTKFAFLYNRYLMPVCLFLSWIALSGFIGLHFNTTTCQVVLTLVVVLALLLCVIINGLILVRVISLWENQRWAIYTIVGGFIVSFGIVTVTLMVSLKTVIGNLVWNPVTTTCFPQKTTPLQPIGWGFSTLYSVVMLIAVCVNAFDRPRPVGQSLAQALNHDGVMFFAGYVFFQLINFCMTVTQNPRVGFMLIFFCWAMCSILANRLILRLQHLDSAAEALRVTARSPAPLTYAAAVTEYNRERGNDLTHRGASSPGSIKGSITEWESQEPRRLPVEVGQTQWTH